MYDLARSVLGKDFISPEEIAKARGLAYTEDQLTLLRNKLPDQAVLEQLRDNGMMLVAGPPTAMSMLDLRTLHTGYFEFKGPEENDNCWYDRAIEIFAYTDTVKALCWVAFRKEPIENSFNKTWLDQDELVDEPMTVPNVAEAVWALTTYKAVRDIHLLESVCVRTSSFDSEDQPVSVGRFDAEGLVVRDFSETACYGELGVSEGRKF